MYPQIEAPTTHDMAQILKEFKELFGNKSSLL